MLLLLETTPQHHHRLCFSCVSLVKVLFFAAREGVASVLFGRLEPQGDRARNCCCAETAFHQSLLLLEIVE